MQHARGRARITVWGGYDLSKPRIRLLLDALRRQDALGAEINIPVWSRIRDKGVAGKARLLSAAIALAAGYPRAIVRLMRQPRSDVILLGYPAIPDIFAVWPVARLRRQQIIVDAFIPIHDTVVRDRGMLRNGGIAARLLWWIERLALRLADRIVVDTDQHADFFAAEFAIDRDRFDTILVGAEPDFWCRERPPAATDLVGGLPADRPIVLFYGQLIPLHGLATILEAVRLTAGEPIHWLLIGSGQEESHMRRYLDQHDTRNLTWQAWVDYEILPDVIAACDVALGIFGSSDKAGRVIPNKMFQVLALGTPLITRSSPAVDSLAAKFPRSIRTVPAGDGAALAVCVRTVLGQLDMFEPVPLETAGTLGPDAGATVLIEWLEGLARTGGSQETIQAAQGRGVR